MRVVWIALIVVAVLLTALYDRVQFYHESKIDRAKIDSFQNVANRAVKKADSLQAITDTLKQKRSIRIVEVTKWREKRLNDTFWATLEDTAKITYLLTENDSLYRVLELDCEIIDKQDATIKAQGVAIIAQDSVINRTLSGIKAVEKENSYLKRVNTKAKRQRNWAFLAGITIGILLK